MHYAIGDRVRLPNKQEWGIGLVEYMPGDGKVHIRFRQAGLKQLDIKKAAIEVVDKGYVYRLGSNHGRNLEGIFRLCHALHAAMSPNRKGKDDGNVGLAIIRDLLDLGELRPSTRKQFLPWCHTGGAFIQGEPIAREICVLIYGRVLPRE